MRMDPLVTEADSRSADAEYQRRRLNIRRIDAELANRPFEPERGDPPGLAAEVQAQHRANRSALEAALEEERSRLQKARQEMAAADQVRRKLEDVLPHYQEQHQVFEKLAQKGFAGNLMASDKRRERIEKEQELNTQRHLIESARASIAQSEKKLAQIESDYRRQLYVERNEAQGAMDRLTQERMKFAHRKGLLELKSPQDGIVKDVATHTVGTVVQPGTVLTTIVPRDEALKAEVWISNEDIGFVRNGQPVKIKLLAFPFQKYGMLDGTVDHVSADAADGDAGNPANGPSMTPGRNKPLVYKALVSLSRTQLESGEIRYSLAAGMQANAEIKLGTRSVAEYLLSPVSKAWHEAGRER
jgi:HlyD family secretion protein